MPAYRPARRTVDPRSLPARERALSWLVTGAPARVGAAVVDLAAAGLRSLLARSGRRA